ncbi:MAG: 6-carboxyhexanoate--CoA ligase [Nitrospirae bacterium RBG_13_43_8]|nr:MAG: 6-carboxyhexanoate--CoA ligase [Nitrospirae bacterium RBG_13_43_8]
MKNLWSIRMRASKKVKSQKSKVKTQNSKYTEIHISGAEGLYETSEIQKVVRKYVERALNHSRGQADRIIITIEDIKQKPQTITALPVVTIENATPKEGGKMARQLLQGSNISKAAIDKAFGLIKKTGMRGAAIITAEKGVRLEPHRGRGIRVSRLGITKSALKHLSSRLLRYGINTETVQEALILASKVLSFKHVIAELCMSDDPDYTTGYVATKKFGYVRIPHIKNKASRSGGRAFFVKEGIDVEDLATYLEKRPVIVGKISCCRGIIPFDEILSHPHMQSRSEEGIRK